MPFSPNDEPLRLKPWDSGAVLGGDCDAGKESATVSSSSSLLDFRLCIVPFMEMLGVDAMVSDELWGTRSYDLPRNRPVMSVTSQEERSVAYLGPIHARC